MVSDTELAERVHQFLRVSDLKKTTNKIVITKLESDFGVDLSNKKSFLREQVDRFLQTQYPSSEEEEVGLSDNLSDVAVSDSEDDSHHHPLPAPVTVQVNDDDNNNDNNNGSSNLDFKPSDKFRRPDKQKKEKNKKQKMSGKFCTLSPELQKFLGVPKMTQAEVVNQLWSYVRKNHLQDPLDGKTIICDETLRDLLGFDSINVLQINKALTKHIWSSASVKSHKKFRKDKPPRKEEREDPDGPDAKVKRKVFSGFLAPHSLSDTLMKFLGTGERVLTRAAVIKRVWGYIKEKKLQDPSDKKTVICDDKLRELFNVDSFHGFTVSKLLTAHFHKI